MFDNIERREILPLKMPHLPSLVGGAFFCACSRNSPSNAKRWGRIADRASESGLLRVIYSNISVLMSHFRWVV